MPTITQQLAELLRELEETQMRNALMAGTLKTMGFKDTAEVYSQAAAMGVVHLDEVRALLNGN